MKRSLVFLGIVAIIAIVGFLYMPLQISTAPFIQELEATPPPPKLSDDEKQRMVEEAQKYFDENLKTTTFAVAGPETRGSTIVIADKEIQLPDDVYVRGLIRHATCGQGIECPEMPVYALAYTDNEDTIGIEANSGKIVEDPKPEDPEEWERIKERFSWLTEQFGG